MGKGPKKSDYAASGIEKAAVQVATSQYQDWRTKFHPLLKKRSVDSQTDATKVAVRRIGNANTMQKLTKVSYPAAQSTTIAGDTAEALTGQLSEANKAARNHQNEVGVDILGKARGLAGTASEGLAQAARLSTSSALAKAQAKQEVQQAKINAVTSMLTTGVGQGIENYSQTGKIFTPGIATTEMDPNRPGVPIYKDAQGIGDYWYAGSKRKI